MGKFDFKKQFKDDYFDRCKTAENLTTVFDNSDEGLIISINSAWGTGKTKFVEMWSEGLKSTDEFSTIYLNAWEADYFNDPLLALIMALEEHCDRLNKRPIGTVANLDTYKEIGIQALTELLKYVTNGHLDILKIKNDIEDGKIDEVRVRFEKHRQIKSDIKKALVDLQGTKKVVFFIDELDRAKPNFVVELIEMIKHYFKVDGYYFVLMTDRVQFDHIIKHYYGNEIGTADYLRKIIDYDFSMKQPDSVKYFEALVEIKGLNIKRIESNYSNGVVYGKYPLLYELLIEYIVLHKFSLRDVDKLCAYLKLLLPTIQDLYNNFDDSQIIISVLLSYFISIRIKNIKAFQHLVASNFSEGENVLLKDLPRCNKNLNEISYNLTTSWTEKNSPDSLIRDIFTSLRNKSSGNDKIGSANISVKQFIDLDGLICLRYLDFTNHFEFIEE